MISGIKHCGQCVPKSHVAWTELGNSKLKNKKAVSAYFHVIKSIKAEVEKRGVHITCIIPRFHKY